MTSDIGPIIVCPLWIVQHPGVTSHALRLWLYLYGQDMIERPDEEFPTRHTIARDLRCSLDSIDRWSQQLVEAKAITITQQSIRGVSGQTNHFQVHLRQPSEAQIYVRPGAVQTADLAALERSKSPPEPPKLQGKPLSISRSGAPTRIYSKKKSTVQVQEIDLFQVFWVRYPRRIGRAKSKLAWEKLGLDTPEQSALVMDGLFRWLEVWSVDRTEQKFIPYPTTWLNQRRWEDEVTPSNKAEIDLSPQSQSLLTATEQFLARHEQEEVV